MSIPPGPTGAPELPPAIRLEGVHAGYGPVHALRGVSLEVRQGEMVSLIGANGAGKTTTLRVISGLLSPRQGRLLVFGQDATHLRADQVVGLGVAHCPEGRQVFPDLTVLENLVLGAYRRPRGAAVQETMERLFEWFPILKERRHQTAGTLSGGEQEMLAIARALMSHPRVLLLDEPSLGLGPLVVDAIFDRLQRLNADGMTMLLVEQNAHLALEVSHRAYVIETGQIVTAGPSAQLAGDPALREAYLGG